MRLVRIKDATPFAIDDETPAKVLEVIFEGEPFEHVHVEVTLRMNDRGNDEAQMRAARVLLRDAIRAAHEALETEASSDPPATS